ncbi:hypothetical protein GOB94_15350 [Granulicella sp. 5B5]|uniref:universal stress protein n=1 Tax=Granulicella sp. 5B5 TaxID=1617967 RepID=UPI0015F65F63|nr:universal stress protein [Granulicella sp. 5B5]QMV19903.1 hypothetical protein GOB94_15350 [Granulicella sp. 5B5]
MAARPIPAKVPAMRVAVEYALRKLVVAHDASAASARALNDAIFLAKKFKSEILVAHIESMGDEVFREESADDHIDLGTVGSLLTADGIKNREILRAGVVGDALFNICCDEHVDLLLLGAYGYGPQDRSTLGSTAENLLRAIPCPALTYGPSVTSSLSSIGDNGPILVPISLPSNDAELQQAIAIAKLFGAKLELLHVEDLGGISDLPRDVRDTEQDWGELTSRLRGEGVSLGWSVLRGRPVEVILGRSLELDSPFILMPLRWGERLSSMTSDNVGAHVIRSSKVPVMTYRVE